MSDKNFPPGSSDSSKPVLQATTFAGDPGAPALYAIPTSPVVPIPCQNDGSNPVYTSATSEIQILKAGALQTGWTLAYLSGSNCSGTVNNTVEPRTASIESVTDDSGYASFSAAKSGEQTLYFRVYFSKMPAGAQGVTGDTGAGGTTGAAGPTGAAGNDGTGLVIQKYVVEVKDARTPTVSNSAGFVRLTFSADHDLVLNESISLIGTGLVYNDVGLVTSVVSSLIVDTDIAYISIIAVDFWTNRHLKTGGTIIPYDIFLTADLQFQEVIPVGAKLQELFFQKVSGATGYLLWDAGYALNPNSGHNAYAVAAVTQTIPTTVPLAADLWDPARAEYTRYYIYLDTDNRRNMHLRARRVSTSYSWGDAELVDNIFNLFFVYKMIPTDWDGIYP